jgi:hypothetical protein
MTKMLNCALGGVGLLALVTAGTPTWTCQDNGVWGVCAPGQVVVGSCSGKNKQSCLAQCDDPTRTGSVDAFLCDDLDNNALDPLPDNTTNATKRSTTLAAHDVAHASPTTPPTTTLEWVCGKAGYEVQCPVNATTNQTGVVVGFCGSGESAACKIDSVKGHFGCDHKKGHDMVNHAVACEMGFEVTLDEEQECYHECMDAQEYKTCAAGYVAVGHCGGASNPKCGHTVTECQAYPRTFSAMKCCQVRKPEWAPAEGRWELAASVGGGGQISQKLSEGIMTTDTKSVTHSWSKSVTHSISMGFSFFGFSFSTSVSKTVSRSVSNTVTHSTTHTLTNTCEAKCDTHPDGLSVFLYQWHMDFKRGYGTAFMAPTTTLDTCNYYCIYAQNPKPPACPLGACADDQCTVCTPGWNVTNTSSNV